MHISFEILLSHYKKSYRSTGFMWWILHHLLHWGFGSQGVNFINIISTHFLYKHRFFYVHVTRENNVCTKNSYAWLWWNWLQIFNIHNHSHGIPMEAETIEIALESDVEQNSSKDEGYETFWCDLPLKRVYCMRLCFQIWNQSVR